MGKYGRTAVMAAELVERDPRVAPREAWQRAVDEVFATSESGRKKACPRDAFLGLCEAGVVRGVRAGPYTGSEKNKGYVLRALEVVRKDSRLLANQAAPWRRAVGHGDKAHNQQLDVLRGLWESGRIR
jgi:hypothetical protein